MCEINLKKGKKKRHFFVLLRNATPLKPSFGVRGTFVIKIYEMNLRARFSDND